jgi:hypothetical protein
MQDFSAMAQQAPEQKEKIEAGLSEEDMARAETVRF